MYGWIEKPEQAGEMLPQRASFLWVRLWKERKARSGHLQGGRGRAFLRCPGERVPDEKDIPPLKEHELPGNTETAGLIREGRTGEGREGRLEPRSVRVVNTGMAAA